MLSFDAFNEVAKETDERKKEIELMIGKLESLEKEKEKEKEASNQPKQEMERKMAAIMKNVE